MASVSWHFLPSANLYAKYSEGYRSGGYDGQTNSPTGFTVPYESETLEAYEIGLKSRWLDNRLQLNAAAFFSDYQDLQVTRVSLCRCQWAARHRRYCQFRPHAREHAFHQVGLAHSLCSVG